MAWAIGPGTDQPTGKERTLTWEGNLTGAHKARQAVNPMYGIDDECISGTGLNGQAADTHGAIWAPWANPAFDPPSIYFDSDVTGAGGDNYGTRLIANLFGDSETAYDLHAMPHPKTYDTPYDIDWRIELHVAEYTRLERLDGTEAVLIDGETFPVTGGNAMPDNLPALRRVFYEVAVEGASAVVSATSGESTAELDLPVPSSFALGNYAPTLNMGATASNVDGGYGFTCEWNGGNPGFDPYVYDDDTSPYGVSEVSITAASSGYVLVGTLTNTTVDEPCDGFGTVAAGEVTCTVAPPIERVYKALVRAWDQPYPEDDVISAVYPTGSALVSGGEASATERLREFSMGALLNTTYSPVYSASEYEDAFVYLSGLAVGASDEEFVEPDDRSDRRDWRCQIRGAKWTAGTLAHAETQAVDIEWTGGSAEGLGYKLAAGQTASATLVALNQIWEAYRYFRLPLKGTGFADRSVTITLSNDRISKSFFCRTGDDGVEIPRTIDGCAPTDTPSLYMSADRRGGRSPLRFQPSGSESPITTGPEELDTYLDDQDGYDDDPESVRGWLWGVNRPTTITISCTLSGDETLEIGDLVLCRQNEPAITLMDPFKGGPAGFDGYHRLWSATVAGGDTTVISDSKGGPFATLEVDGRIAFDLPFYWRFEPVSGDPEWVYPSISDATGWFGAFPGVSWSEASTWPLPYVDNGAFSLFVGGGGATASLDESDNVFWAHWIDAEIGDLSAQELLDYVRDYPGCRMLGDGYGTGVYAICKVLQARAEGLTLNSATHSAAKGRIVRTKDDVSGAGSGTGTSDERGFCRTGLPFGRGPKPHETALGSKAVHGVWRSRLRARTSWLAEFVGGHPALASRRDGLVFALLGDVDERSMGKAEPFAPTTFSSVPTIDADFAALATGMGTNGLVWLARIVDGVADLRATNNLGLSWDPVITLPDSDAIALCRAPDGDLYVFTLEGDTVRGRRYSPLGGMTGSDWDTNLTGIGTGATLSATAFAMSGSKFGIDLAVQDGDATVYLSTDGGRSFA